MHPLKQWMHEADHEHIILGYGSLMNTDSRQRFSGIPHEGIAVHVKGYRRAWVTRSETEQQTYVGASPVPNGVINAQLIPVTMDPALADREKDYRFEQVPVSDIVVFDEEPVFSELTDFLATRKVWICRTLDEQHADKNYPISQSYIDTCMAGCLQHGGEEEARLFVASTDHWSDCVRHDREQPVYPRAASVSRQEQQTIDRIVAEVL